ncbi:MAG: hypothetical protein D6781_09190 [Verrucomicrobia bacterium]|nr:MAG: hypothetical protein D6781_09190 [Verrucomicrobiota bacterium]
MSATRGVSRLFVRRKEGGWLAVTLAIVLVLAVVLGVGVAVAWRSTPAFLARRIAGEARKIGFEEASVRVHLVELERLEARQLHLGRGGLSIDAERLAAAFLPEEVMDGRLRSLEVEGLVVRLDFRERGPGGVSEALRALAAALGGGAGGGGWPIGELSVPGARIELVFADATYAFTVDLAADRNLAGEDEFRIDIAHRELRARAEVALDTTGGDGHLRIERFVMAPALLAELAERIGGHTLPANSRFDSDSIRLSGTLAIADWQAADAEIAAVVPRLRWSYPGIEGELSSTRLELHRDRAGRLFGRAEGGAILYGTLQEWSAGPLAFEAELDRGEVRVRGTGFPLAWGDWIDAKVSLSMAAGVPALGGEREARARLLVQEAEIGGEAIEPMALAATGWREALSVEFPEVRFRRLPLAVRNGAITANDLAGDAPQMRGHFEIFGSQDLDRYLPAGWALANPPGWFRVGRVDFQSAGAGGTGLYEGTFRSRMRDVTLEGPAGRFAWSPDVTAAVRLDHGIFAMDMDATLEDIRTDLARWPKALDRASMRIELRDIGIESVIALLKGGTPAQDVKIASVVSTLGSGTHGRMGLSVEYDRETQSWSAVHRIETEDLADLFPDLHAENAALSAETRWSAIPHASVRHWLEGAAREQDPEAGMLPDWLFRKAEAHVVLSSDRLELPGEMEARWCRVELEKTRAAPDEPPVQARLDATAGRMTVAGQILEQPRVQAVLSGDLERVRATGRLGAVFGGLEAAAGFEQAVAIDWEKGVLAGEGTFRADPIVLARSNLPSLFSEALADVVVDGSISAEGTVQWNSATGAWTGRGRLTLNDLAAESAAQRVRASGIAGTLEFDGLPEVKTPAGQEIHVATIEAGDLRFERGRVRFQLLDPRTIRVEAVEAAVFDGRVCAEPFTLRLPDPDLAVDLHFEGLDLGRISAFIKPFRGRMTGRLNGRLPVGLLAGQLVLGEGVFELDRDFPATFSYPAKGMFTANLSAETLAEQMNRLPYELLEEGLASVDLEKLRVELFDRDRPGTPVHIELSGKSTTERAVVPFEIETNVNGTVAQVINLFLRLATL